MSDRHHWSACASLCAALACTPAAADGPAASMAEVRAHFARCLHLPDVAAGSRPTLYFSLTHEGGIVARPRIVLFGFKGTDDARHRLVDDIGTAFAACVPLKLDAQMAASLPGKVYFLQYVVDAGHRTNAVLFRPFGSHGGGGSAPLPLEPREDGFVPPSPALELRQPPARPKAFGPPPPPAPYILLAPKDRRGR